MKFINRFCLFVTNRWTLPSRNAYILTAVEGSNFCTSAKEAFSLILRNMVSTGTCG